MSKMKMFTLAYNPETSDTEWGGNMTPFEALQILIQVEIAEGIKRGLAQVAQVAPKDSNVDFSWKGKDDNHEGVPPA